MIPIKITNLLKSYGKVQALKSVSLTINEGDLFGLIGPDGAGKTTLIRIIPSLLMPDSGSVEIFGMDSVKYFREIRSIVGYMPGRFSLYGDLSVKENLEFFAGVFGTTIQQNYSLIKDIYIHLEPFKNRLAGRLSGGMKQKLALCCALIHKPKLLLLDEPTTGVDAVSRKEFWAMLRKLKNEGITILVSTSYMDEASLCDGIALIQNGLILGTDTPSSLVMKYPNDLFSIRHLDSYSVLNFLRQRAFCHSAFLFGQDIHLSVEKGAIQMDSLQSILNDSGFKDVSINSIEASVEDSFMWLMSKKEEI
jgi:ABC-type multidrug transport system ATPase subunit